jgi:hypothetical protein
MTGSVRAFFVYFDVLFLAASAACFSSTRAPARVLVKP